LRELCLDELNEAMDRFADLFMHPLVHDLADFIEDIAGTRYQQFTAELGPHAQRSQHGQPGVLRQDRAEPTWRTTDDRDRPASEYSRDVGRRPRQPVDSVLKDAGHGVVVLRRGEQQTVHDRDPLLKLRDCFRNPLRGLLVAVIERDLCDASDLYSNAVRREFGGSAPLNELLRRLPATLMIVVMSTPMLTSILSQPYPAGIGAYSLPVHNS
jgi:hypothetical protein